MKGSCSRSHARCGLVLVWCALFQLGSPNICAQDVDSAAAPRSLQAARSGSKFGGTSRCSGCHSGSGNFPSDTFNPVTLKEFPIWDTGDLHKLAYHALTSERGKLNGLQLSKNVLDPATGCVQCHSLASELPPALDDENKRKEM